MQRMTRGSAPETRDSSSLGALLRGEATTRRCRNNNTTLINDNFYGEIRNSRIAETVSFQPRLLL